MGKGQGWIFWPRGMEMTWEVPCNFYSCGIPCPAPAEPSGSRRSIPAMGSSFPPGGAGPGAGAAAAATPGKSLGVEGRRERSHRQENRLRIPGGSIPGLQSHGTASPVALSAARNREGIF